MQLKPPPQLAFVHGPSTADATSLRKWLEQQTSTVRLPVFVKPSNPPTAVPGSNIKVFSEQPLRISDWRAFWEKRRDRSLEQIHAELEPLVREYWKTHGTTQTVP